MQLASDVSNGTQFTNSAVLQDTQGHSSSSNETAVVGGTTGVGGGGVVASGSTSSIVLPPPVAATTSTPLNQTFSLGRNAQGLGVGETTSAARTRERFPTSGGEATESPEDEKKEEVVESETVITTGAGGVQQITITGNRVEITQQVASASSRPSKAQQEKEASTEDEGRKTTGRSGGACASIVSLRGTHDPDPILNGGRITFTFTFVNTSEDVAVKDLSLRDVLPDGMTFVSASNDGIEFGNVVTWHLGGLQPGEQGTRSLVAQADFPATGAALLTNNNAYIEDPEYRCARAHQPLTVQPVSLGDDDNDKFPNADEVRCGSDPKDAASTCYSLELLEEDRVVERGAEMTFTVMLRRNFNFEGEVTFNTPNSIPGVLWTFSRLSAVLNRTDGMVSFPFTIKTTTTTPLGQHIIIIQAINGGMTSEKTLVLNVVP